MVEILNREDFDDEETRREFMDQIEQEINRLDILVKDLLQLSRLSLSTVLLEREKTDLCLVIDKAVKSLEKKAEKKKRKITHHTKCAFQTLMTCCRLPVYRAARRVRGR